MTLSDDISYVTIEALPKRYVETGIMSTRCEAQVIYGILAGFKTHMEGDDATPFIMILLPDGTLKALNLLKTSILTIEMYDGLTRELCIFRSFENDQKKAFAMIVDTISMFTTKERMMADNELINTATYSGLPDRYTAAGKKVSAQSSINSLNSVKRTVSKGHAAASSGVKSQAAVGGCGGNGCGKAYQGHQGYHNGYTAYQKPTPRFFKRSSVKPKLSALKTMFKKVQELQLGEYEPPDLPELPESEDVATAAYAAASHNFYD